ncbi:MAG: matrixin family metalloprotease [Gemmatimonadota bacterium]
MGYRPFLPRLYWTFAALAAAALIGCSGSGGGPTGPDFPSSQAGEASIDFSGQVSDQQTGVPLTGIHVSGGGASAWTDGAGRFELAASQGAELTLSGAGYYERVTVLEGVSGNFSLVPLSFDMTAFNDVARDHSPGTLRWLSSPAVYVDVRAHSFGAGQSVPAEWVDQVVALAPQFLSRWTGGALLAGSVSVGSAPPSPGTPGTLVISFDEDPSRYPSAASAGTAIAAWDRAGVIRSATVRLRFSGLTGSAAAFSRQAVLGHEIGHALGLAHMDGTTSSMMAAVVRTPELTAFDRAAGALLYDRLPGTRADDREAATDARSALAGR